MPASIKMPRPICTTDNCDNKVALIKNHYDSNRVKTGVTWRKYCSKCHNTRTAEKHGLKNITEIIARRNGFSSAAEYSRHCLEQRAEEAGFDSVADYVNSTHPYRKYRKTYCENQDGRLGFKCTTTVTWDGMLDVDHIDGDPRNNEEENLQTLCKCCHAYKGYEAKDYLSPGRKAYKITY